MVSKIAEVKKIILDFLSDGKEHSSEELRCYIIEKGMEIDKKSSILRTAIYQLRSTGTDIYSRDRGIYQIREKAEKNNYHILKDFSVLLPEQKVSPMCIYIHEDGILALNGKLNNEIESRQIEIRVHSDGRKIALIPDGENCHKFTKSGRTKNLDLVKLLRKKRINVPATFEMEQEKSSGIWIGEIQKNTETYNKKNIRKSD